MSITNPCDGNLKFMDPKNASETNACVFKEKVVTKRIDMTYAQRMNVKPRVTKLEIVYSDENYTKLSNKPSWLQSSDQLEL